MREILFRGKRTDNGEWVQGYYVYLPIGRHDMGEHLIQTINPNGRIGQWYDVVPETVGQFTGLTDKNGNNIAEGDIVHYVYEPRKNFWNANQNSIIKWKHSGFFMEGVRGTNKYAMMSGWLTTVPHGYGEFFEVIGNIHDNPELVGGISDG